MRASSPSPHVQRRWLRRRVNRHCLHGRSLPLRCAAACTLLCVLCAAGYFLQPISSRLGTRIFQQTPQDLDASTAVSVGDAHPVTTADPLGTLKDHAQSFAESAVTDSSTQDDLQIVNQATDTALGDAMLSDDPALQPVSEPYELMQMHEGGADGAPEQHFDTPAQAGALAAAPFEPSTDEPLADSPTGAEVDDSAGEDVLQDLITSPNPFDAASFDGADAPFDAVTYDEADYSAEAVEDAADAAVAAGAAVRALEEDGCAAAATSAPTHHLRVKYTATPTKELEDELNAAAGNISAAKMDPESYQFPFRVPEVPGAREYGDVQWCPGSLEPPPEEVPAVDPAYRAIFVIGAQKAGTTWLHNAFAKHPGMVHGETRIKSRQGQHYKELQFFNSWPARSTGEFLSMWPPGELAAMRKGDSQKFLFDATPEYLLNAAVAPRMKQMVPQAKIVIVLRDPTERAFSSWSMVADRRRFCDSKQLPVSRLCVERTFHDTFATWHGSHAAQPECRFTTPGANVSWGDCFGCRYNLFAYQQCCDMRQEHGDALFPCFGVPRGFSVMDYSSYAAQIAWWLEFFPPEQLYIVTSDTLYDETKRVKVLNDILDFAGLKHAPRFRPAALNRASSFKGKYHDVSDEDVAAKAPVRRFHAPQVRDLRALLARFWPHVDLAGFPE